MCGVIEKKLKALIIFFNALLFLTSCFHSNFSDNNLENESRTTDSFVAETAFNETTEAIADEDAVNASSTELNEDNNELEADFQYFIPLKEYLIKLKDDDTLLLYYPNLVIYLFDYDNDSNSDALASEGSFNGTLYYIIKNINDPQLIYSFSSFDEANLLYDTKGSQIIIKYIENYGLNTYATSETNFIYLGDKINEIKHVHFSGTSKPEEFYIESQGKKIICTEEELNDSISEIEQNLEFFSDFETLEMTIADDEITIIDLDSFYY